MFVKSIITNPQHLARSQRMVGILTDTYRQFDGTWGWSDYTQTPSLHWVLKGSLKWSWEPSSYINVLSERIIFREASNTLNTYNAFAAFDYSSSWQPNQNSALRKEWAVVVDRFFFSCLFKFQIGPHQTGVVRSTLDRFGFICQSVLGTSSSLNIYTTSEIAHH